MTKLSTFPSTLHSFRRTTNRPFSTWRSIVLTTQALLVHDSLASKVATNKITSNRTLAQVRPEPLSELWFTASFPAKSDIEYTDGHLSSVSLSEKSGSGKDHKPLDERTLKLGKSASFSILQPYLVSDRKSLLPTNKETSSAHSVAITSNHLYYTITE